MSSHRFVYWPWSGLKHQTLRLGECFRQEDLACQKRRGTKGVKEDWYRNVDEYGSLDWYSAYVIQYCFTFVMVWHPNRNLVLVAFSSFAVAAYTSSQPLTSEIIFPAISLFMLLQFPLAMVRDLLPHCIEFPHKQSTVRNGHFKSYWSNCLN